MRCDLCQVTYDCDAEGRMPGLVIDRNGRRSVCTHCAAQIVAKAMEYAVGRALPRPGGHHV
jgi:hypothetical protein